MRPEPCYFGGSKCALAKRGKLQIVCALLCDREGFPVAVEVFRGNTADPGSARRSGRRTWGGSPRCALRRFPTLVDGGTQHLSLFNEQDLAEISTPELYPGASDSSCAATRCRPAARIRFLRAMSPGAWPVWTCSGVSRAMSPWRCSWLYQRKKLRQWSLASSMEPNEAGKPGWNADCNPPDLPQEPVLRPRMTVTQGTELVRAQAVFGAGCLAVAFVPEQ